jgi:hypothetical protein
MTITNSFLNQQRLQADEPADALIQKMFITNKQNELYAALKISEAEIVKGKHKQDVFRFLKTRKSEPLWYDEKRILSGQHFFEQYGMEIMTLLGAMALPYCYAGTPGNKALYLSEKMRQSPAKRLADTAEFIVQVSSAGTLSKSGLGPIHINKTRLIHAIARYYVQKSAWDNSWGLPINQEDMAGTNLAFSYIIITGLLKSGFVLDAKQKEDFIYLWRYIGYQLNINEELLAGSIKEAHLLTKQIEKRNFRKSAEGVALCQSLIQYYKSAVPADKSFFVEAQIRYLLGNDVSAYIGLQGDYISDKINELIFSIREVQNYFTVQQSSYAKLLQSQSLMKNSKPIIK